MKILAIAITLFVAVPAHAAEKAWYQGCPASIKNSYECAQYIERGALKKDTDLVSREADALVFKLYNGQTTKLVDDSKTADGTLHYNLSEVYRDIGYALVHGQYYEGSTYLLVNLGTGQVEDINGRPVVSPAKAYLASTNSGGISGYTKSIVKIYRLTKPHLTLEWSTTEWDPSDPKWITDSKLMLFKNVFSEELSRKHQHSDDWYIKEKISIELKSGQWTIGKP